MAKPNYYCTRLYMETGSNYGQNFHRDHKLLSASATLSPHFNSVECNFKNPFNVEMFIIKHMALQRQTAVTIGALNLMFLSFQAGPQTAKSLKSL